MLSDVTSPLEKTISELENWFMRGSNIVVAFSGGVDSAVLAAAAARSHKKKHFSRLLAIMAIGPVGTLREQHEAQELAAFLDIPFELLSSSDLDNTDFTRNDSLRCYYCKRHRFTEILNRVAREDVPFLLIEGSNADDQADYRPGTKAVRELGVQSPLAELGIDKAMVRTLARHWELPVAEKPSNPCLATRLAYGLPLTEKRLRIIEQGEEFLRQQGITSCRLRMDADHLARLELHATDWERMIHPPLRTATVEFLRNLGFSQISLDLEGFTSGKMNRDIEKMATF